MNERENLHSGHRARMVDKFIENPDIFSDHELLEIILFSALPRVNTNNIAHNLLRMFGSLEKVFNASPEKLMAVGGIGKRAAGQLVLFGKVLARINKNKQPDIKFGFSFEHNKNEILNYFSGCVDEKLVIMMLDDKMRKIGELTYSNNCIDEVLGDVNEIANAYSILKPVYSIIAHNHPSGNLKPSHSDDVATAKINLLSATHGITLLDHVIAHENEAFSYHLSGRLLRIKGMCEVDNIILRGFDKDYE